MLSNPRADGFNVMTHQKPRVLIFSLAYFPLVGGAEIAVKEITDRLGSPTCSPDGAVGVPVGAPTHSGVGVDFDLITLRFNGDHKAREVIGNVNIHRIGGAKWAYPLKAMLLARKLHRKNNYKIIWSVMAAYAGFAALFFKLSYPRVPMLLTLQEGDSEKHILSHVGFFYPLWRLIFKKADYVQAISNYLVDFARRHGAKCSVEVVPNGVNLNSYKTNSDASQRLGRGPDQKRRGRTYTIITTSRLVYKNGVDILIRAIALLEANPYKLEAIIVGDGPDRPKLEKLAQDLGIADQVKFVGHVDPVLIPEYLAQADIFVRPSRSEGLGNSFLEAMAAGLPAIGTGVGGIVDFLKDGETGLVCQVDDPKDLAQKIIRILNDDELYRKLSEGGRKLVEEKYSWDFIVQSMNRIFVKLLNLIESEDSSESERPNLLTFSPRKLLLATGIYPPEVGGPATYAALLEKELPRRGIGVSVLPFRAVRKWPKGLRHFLYFIKTLRLCRRHNLVLAQDTISVGLPSLLAAKLCRKKFIIRVPGDYVWEQSVQRFGVKDSIDNFQNKKYGFKVELLRSVQRFVVSRADLVITPSNYFRDLVRGWVKDKNKVVTIYNGIDLPPSSKIQVPSSKIIISAGRLVPWKGFGFLIELMKDLPEWRLVIAGDGPDREALKLQVTRYKIQDRVKLLGQIPREELMEKLQEAEMLVLNTHFESFSFQVVEAMSLGLPVITTNIGNLSEIIDNGVDGILAEPNNKKQFLDAINKLDKDENFRKSISEKAIKKALRFSIENTINELVDLL